MTDQPATQYRSFTAPVRGGDLAGGVWNEGATHAVLAIHGITASHLAWPLVAERLEDVTTIAPDLRGRGRSNGLPAPWGIRDHADDMARVLDAFGIERTVLVGHSMGGFVAVRTAAQHPDRVSALVLVDGGLPLPFEVPDGVAPEDVPTLLLGPGGERLKQIYPSREAYLEFWRQHPAVREEWNPAVEAYADYDLDELPEGFRSASRLDAVATNVVQMTGDDGYREALAGLSVPIDFVHAARGLLNEVPPLYPAEVLNAGRALVEGLRVHEAPQNHYGIVLTPDGADRVSGVIAAALVGARTS